MKYFAAKSKIKRKTAFRLSAALALAIGLAGCSAPPQEGAPTDENAPRASALPAEKTAIAEPAQKMPGPTDTDTSAITWLTSYDQALETATQENRPVMIDFYADWCQACKVLDKEVYTESGVIKKSKEFINLRLDADKETTLAERYKVYALPTLIFLDGSGKVLWRVEGVPTASHFIDTMQKVQDKFVART